MDIQKDIVNALRFETAEQEKDFNGRIEDAIKRLESLLARYQTDTTIGSYANSYNLYCAMIGTEVVKAVMDSRKEAANET